MAEVKAVLVGVSNYYISGADDLPFCVNDIKELKNALISGLNVNEDCITSIGSDGDVKKEDFIDSLIKAQSELRTDDTLIFYFSGHGTTIEEKHYLVLSDDLISTNEVLEYFKEVGTRSKIIFLDCCLSGNYNVENSTEFDINKSVEEFHGNGYAVLSSSSATQLSYGHPEKPVSVFTSFLCSAITDRHIIKEGKKSLYDIKKLVSLYLSIWSRNNPRQPQFPIYRSSMGGTVFFDVEQYTPYKTDNIYKEYENYIIYKVDPVHTGSAKRYSVKVILKEPSSFEEISDISKLVVDEIRSVEVYSNSISERHWTGRLANIVWIYYGRDESDHINNNYICHTTWIDNKQDSEWWYKVNGNNKLFINGVHFDVHTYYESLKAYINDNIGKKSKLVKEMKYILEQMLTLAEKVIFTYNEYLNEDISEEHLIEVLKPFEKKISEYYMKSNSLEGADNELHDWDAACFSLFGTIHDLTLFYSAEVFLNRDSENRKACMNMTIKRYYEDLNKVIQFEKELSGIIETIS